MISGPIVAERRGVQLYALIGTQTPQITAQVGVDLITCCGQVGQIAHATVGVGRLEQVNRRTARIEIYSLVIRLFRPTQCNSASARQARQRAGNPRNPKARKVFQIALARNQAVSVRVAVFTIRGRHTWRVRAGGISTVARNIIFNRPIQQAGGPPIIVVVGPKDKRNNGVISVQR